MGTGIFVRETEGRNPFRRPRLGRMIILKCILKMLNARALMMQTRPFAVQVEPTISSEVFPISLQFPVVYLRLACVSCVFFFRCPEWKMLFETFSRTCKLLSLVD